MSARRALISSPARHPPLRRRSTNSAAASASTVAERLKQRIWTELYPCLIDDIRSHSPRASADSTSSLPPLAAAERQAQTLLLRLLILFLADARGMISARAWQQVRWHATHQTIEHRRWRQRVERALQGYFQATGATAAPRTDVSPSVLSRVIDGLSGDPCQENAAIDYRSFEPRLLGEVYEGLLALGNTSGRKSNGSYYTPSAIVDYIVEQTLDPILADFQVALQERNGGRPAGRRATIPLPWRVLDPAMGCGYFLLAAVQRMAAHARAALSCSDAAAQRALLRRAARCVYGLDIDPLAVEVSRASLWLACQLGRRDMLVVNRQLRCGNALLEDHFDAAEPAPCGPGGQFDAVIGNPPYGASLSAAERTLACRRLPQMRHHGDTAVGFLQRSLEWLGPRGRFGLIVPKALTYSFAWRRLRAYLERHVLELVDISQGWAEVRLEQVIVLSTADNSSTSYQSRVWRDGKRSPRVAVPWRLAAELDAWPCGLNRLEQRLASQLSRQQSKLGELCRTFRGLPLQAKCHQGGTIPVLGGRDLMRWGVRSQSGYATDAGDLSRFSGQRLLVQNIVAHLLRPRPHLRLIGCHDATGRATLDTINNIVARRDGVDLHGVLALLHSEFINWYVYAVIYNHAVRTMHFDQYFLNKIPLPVDWPALLAEIAPLSRTMQATVLEELAAGNAWTDGQRQQAGRQRRRLEREINERVNRAYGWQPAAG